MKKFFTTISLLLFTILVFSQEKKHSPFVSIFSGMSSQRDFALSGEVGTWGTKSPTSFSLTFDAVKNVDKSTPYSYWVGVKPYYTFYEREKISYMLYIAPKVKINNGFDFLIENGLSMNYTLTNQVLFGTCLAFQSGKDYNLIPSISAGFVFLLQK